MRMAHVRSDPSAYVSCPQKLSCAHSDFQVCMARIAYSLCMQLSTNINRHDIYNLV